jgi:hypothetical protein
MHDEFHLSILLCRGLVHVNSVRNFTVAPRPKQHEGLFRWYSALFLRGDRHKLSCKLQNDFQCILALQVFHLIFVCLPFLHSWNSSCNVHDEFPRSYYYGHVKIDSRARTPPIVFLKHHTCNGCFNPLDALGRRSRCDHKEQRLGMWI